MYIITNVKELDYTLDGLLFEIIYDRILHGY